MKNLKFLIFAISFILMSFTAVADYHTNAPKASGGGAWELPSSWESLNGPGCTISSNVNIYIDAGDSLYTTCPLAISGNPTIIVRGILTINGMLLTGNVDFDIQSGGKLIINGILNFSGNSTLDVTNNGSVIVNGGVMSNGNAYDFKCNGWVEIHGFGCDKCTQGVPDVADCVALDLCEDQNPNNVQIKTYSITNDGFSLSFLGYKGEFVNMVVYDMVGKTVIKKDFIIPTNVYKISQDDLETNLKTGVYTVTTIINYELVTYKLIIL